MKRITLGVVALFVVMACTNDGDEGIMLNDEAFKKSDEKKITICHKESETITISVNALQAHLDHGDKIGPCGFTYVPDDNFEQALIDLGYDDFLDDFVLTENIEGEKTLELIDKGITDLTGIQDFTSLTRLDCSFNNISEIDFSGQSNMAYIRANDNLLNSLDVSRFTGLQFLYLHNNRLMELILNSDPDANLALRTFWCQNNMLEQIDLSNYDKLEKIRCDDNYLTSLNVKNGSNGLISTLTARRNDVNLLITVDNPTDANAGLPPYDNWKKDNSASYN